MITRQHINIREIIFHTCVTLINGVWVRQVDCPHTHRATTLKHWGCVLQVNWLWLIGHEVGCFELSLFLVWQKVGSCEIEAFFSLSDCFLLSCQQQGITVDWCVLTRDVLFQITHLLRRLFHQIMKILISKWAFIWHAQWCFWHSLIRMISYMICHFGLWSLYTGLIISVNTVVLDWPDHIRCSVIVIVIPLCVPGHIRHWGLESSFKIMIVVMLLFSNGYLFRLLHQALGSWELHDWASFLHAISF